MMIMAYDWYGVIVTDRVPVGTIVTGKYYETFLRMKLRPKIRESRPELLSSGALILHNNARPHMVSVVTALIEKYDWGLLPHPPYSPDMSPPDFDLFPKLKGPLRGRRFADLEQLSLSVTQQIRDINKNNELQGIQDLPKRWKLVIEKHGDYIEGL